MKHALLAAFIVLLQTQALQAGNIWPSSSSYSPPAILSKLTSHAGITIPHVEIPKLNYSGGSSSFTWTHDSTSDDSHTHHWPDLSGSNYSSHHWPLGNIPSPWTWSSGYPAWGFSDEKVEQHFEDKFDTLSQELDDLIANTPDYADTDDYQELIDDIEKLIDKHGKFVDRVGSKIDHISNAIDRTSESITHLNDLIDRLESNSHIPAKALEQIEKQIDRAKSRIENQVTKLESKKSDLEAKLEQYGMFQSDVEDYLENVQNTTATPLTTTTLAAESVVNSLSVSLNQAAAEASQSFAATTQESSASTAYEFQAAALQTTSNSTEQTETGSATFNSLTSLQTPTVDSVTPNSEQGEVQFTAGANLHETVSGGAANVGGVDVTFESQQGGTFSSDYFQTSNDQSLAQSIGQTAFDKINFLLSDELQGWELHFDGDFNGSASIVLGYDESILPPGIDESQLQIMHFNSLIGEWELPDGFTVDTEANQFRFWVNSFSPFVLTFNANSSANPEPSTGVIFTAGLLLLAARRRRKIE